MRLFRKSRIEFTSKTSNSFDSSLKPMRKRKMERKRKKRRKNTNTKSLRKT